MAIDNIYMNSLQELMVTIPKGIIMLRDDRIKKQWEVAVNEFLLAKYPVTQRMYTSITGTSPSIFKGDQKPVESVSFIDSVTFCKKKWNYGRKYHI